MQFFFTFVVKNSEMGRYKKNLAPNGKPSNLSDIQYKLVRTPEFKAWFGDWENDPENASKVLDENGEPLVVYHGTSKEFKVFEKQDKLSNPHLLGGDSSIGFFFTQDKERALRYSKRQSKDIILIQSFLNLRNPYYFTSITYNSIANNFKKGNLLREHLQEIGYSDGFIIDDFYTICVYEPNQIKLADGSNTTFNANDPSIDDSQTKKGISIEQEHKETLEKVASGEISVEEAIKETAVEHIKENPNYYDELEKIEKPITYINTKNFDCIEKGQYDFSKVDIMNRDKENDTIIYVNPKEINEKHFSDYPQFSLYDSNNLIGDRLDRVKKFLLEELPDCSEKQVDGETLKTMFTVPIVKFDDKGKLFIEDGRHRLLVAEQMGFNKFPIQVPKGQVGMFEKKEIKEDINMIVIRDIKGNPIPYTKEQENEVAEYYKAKSDFLETYEKLEKADKKNKYETRVLRSELGSDGAYFEKLAKENMFLFADDYIYTVTSVGYLNYSELFFDVDFGDNDSLPFAQYYNSIDKTVFDLLEVKRYKMPKAINLTVSPENEQLMKLHRKFTSDDELRPSMLGTHFDERGAVSTNGHIMLFTPYKNGEVAGDGNYCYTSKCLKHENDVKTARYPQYDAVLPTKFMQTIDLDIEYLMSFLETATSYELYTKVVKMLIFKFESEEFGVGAEFLYNAIDSLVKLGHKKISLNYVAYNKALVFTPTGTTAYGLLSSDFALVMPLLVNTGYVANNSKDYMLVYNLETNCVTELDNEYCFDFEKAEINNLKKELRKEISEVKQIKKELEEVKEEKAIDSISDSLDIINKVAEQEQFNHDNTPDTDIKNNSEIIEDRVKRLLDELNNNGKLTRYINARGGRKLFDIIVKNKDNSFKRYESANKGRLGILQNDGLSETDIIGWLKKTMPNNETISNDNSETNEAIEMLEELAETQTGEEKIDTLEAIELLKELL